VTSSCIIRSRSLALSPYTSTRWGKFPLDRPVKAITLSDLTGFGCDWNGSALASLGKRASRPATIMLCVFPPPIASDSLKMPRLGTPVEAVERLRDQFLHAGREHVGVEELGCFGLRQLG
jgi:hypothetical protein